jgi:hypothetical protein
MPYIQTLLALAYGTAFGILLAVSLPITSWQFWAIFAVWMLDGTITKLIEGVGK